MSKFSFVQDIQLEEPYYIKCDICGKAGELRQGRVLCEDCFDDMLDVKYEARKDV